MLADIFLERGKRPRNRGVMRADLCWSGEQGTLVVGRRDCSDSKACGHNRLGVPYRQSH